MSLSLFSLFDSSGASGLSFFLSFSFSLSSVKHQCVGNVKGEGEAKEGGKGVNPMKVYDEGSSILAPFPGGRRI